MMKTAVLSLLIATVASTAATAQSTQIFTASKINEYGLVYTLPQTRLDITVVAEQTVETPGEFRLYSKKYLNIDPILEKSAKWTLKSIIINTAGTPDQNARYLVQFKSGSTPFMLLDNNDAPIAVNDESATLPSSPILPAATPLTRSILDSPAADQAMTQEMLLSSSTAMRAKLAADKIYELRQSRNDIISGNADQMPSDGEAMKLALDNLQSQEQALTAMFTGTTQKATAVRTYALIPTAKGGDYVIARISVVDGPVDADNLSGMPINLNIAVTERGVIPRNDNGEEKRFPKNGLAYRIPGKATATVTFNGNTVATHTFDLAQAGIVFGLDPGIFSDKKAPAYVIFDPSTGAIKELGTKH